MNSLHELKSIFFAIKGNPRALKGAARQLYFAYPVNRYAGEDDVARQRKIESLVPDFAEQALQINFGYVWVNELQRATPEARGNCYRALDALFTDTLASWDDMKELPPNRFNQLLAYSDRFPMVLQELHDQVLRREGFGDRAMTSDEAYRLQDEAAASEPVGPYSEPAPDDPALGEGAPADGGEHVPEEDDPGKRYIDALLSLGPFARLVQYGRLIRELHKLERRGEADALRDMMLIVHFAARKATGDTSVEAPSTASSG